VKTRQTSDSTAISKTSPGVRPRDAAGLVLLRRTGGDDVVLLGRRARSARFLPGIYAFPGGALEASDLIDPGYSGAPLVVPERLDKRSQRHARAFARAALRETFEETGLLLGRPLTAPLTAAPPTAAALTASAVAQAPWHHYRSAALQPAFDAMKLFARAITPAHAPRRFHNRFFLADGNLAVGRLKGNGELEDLAWVPVTRALTLPMAQIGTLVLREALAHLAEGAARPAARFIWRRGETRSA